MSDLRTSIESHLQAFPSAPLRQASLDLLSTLGYQSDKTVELEGSKPQAFLDLLAQSNPDATFDQKKALFADWTSADLLFQLTDEEISGETSLFEETEIKPCLLKSYLFFAIELNGKSTVNGAYARGKLTAIARQINRVFPMPVMVLIKHPHEKKDALSIAVINRRANKREQHKDVLGKVTIIRDISLSEPHRGHLDILDSFAVPNLVHPDKLPIHSFDTLHAAWEEIFNVELLNKRFYKELANWYFWALPQVEFPADLEPDDEKRRATGLIRLLTRLIFCWFIKEKGLIPESLFHHSNLADILKDFDPDSDDSSQYYHAILQNLFFATLNQRMGKNNKGEAHRQFALDEGFQKNRATHDLNNYYRYEAEFQGTPEDALRHFADVPFLNGGLFECLDRRDEDEQKTHYLDGFSRNAKKRPHVPNHLFFSDEIKGVDLSDVYHDTKRKRESVSGLLRILNRYKFTIVENTPIDQEIALDPELLGKVFENLLASYNEETKTTARKQTGSFYTPRPIVDYMVDESLKAHLAQALADKTSMSREDADTGLEILFAYTEREHAFSPKEIDVLLDAIHSCKILDPACGSGAFPMGVLHKLVYILTKLDPGNQRWQARQIEAAQIIPDATAREAAIAAIEKDFAENEDDYGRKLYLIENCLYGIDIQPIAIQISKLRFFISLICDQKTNKDKAKNHGIRPLPNLETKFVAADTLIGLPIAEDELFIAKLIEPIERQIEIEYHRHFNVQRRDQKLRIQRTVQELRKKIADTIVNELGASEDTDVVKKARHIAKWDPFDPQAKSAFFDPHWMFGQSLAGGFDIVIGNPPYLQLSKTEWATSTYINSLKSRYGTAGGRANTFIFFIHVGMELLQPGGTLAYIVPNTILTQDYYEDTRSLILQNRLRSIVQYTRLPFENAVVENVTLVVTKGDPKASDQIVVLEDDLSEQTKVSSKPSSVYLSNRKKAIAIYSDAILEDLFSRELPVLDAYCHINQAIALKGDRKLSLRSSNPNGDFLPLLDGRNINRYQTRWNQVYLDYDLERIHSCKRKDIFLSPEKLFFRRVSENLIFTYDDQQFFALNTLVVVNLRQGSSASIKYLLALLNSSLMNYTYKKRFKSTKRVFSEIQARSVGQLPVLVPQPNHTKHLEKLVTLLLVERSQSSATTSSGQFIEDLIDACVMECYFREHMAERDLLFLDDFAPHLDGYDPDASETAQRAFLDQLVSTLNAPSSKIRNRLLRLTADSPDLLAVIKQEGKV